MFSFFNYFYVLHVAKLTHVLLGVTVYIEINKYALYVSVEGNIFNNTAEYVLLMFVEDKYLKDTSVYPSLRFFKNLFYF